MSNKLEATFHGATPIPGLHVIDNLVQGSDKWLAHRCGTITASVVGQLITSKTIKPASNDYSRALTNQLVAERITGWVDPIHESSDMLRGTLDEPYARDKYAEHYAPVAEVGFMWRQFDGYRIGYSPDGLVGDKGLIEIKSRRPKKHLSTILENQVPAENMAQLQAGLLVSGRDWIDYVSYCGGLPLYVKRVYPDTRWFDAITEATQQFEANAATMIAAYEARTKGLPLTDRIDHFQEMSF